MQIPIFPDMALPNSLEEFNAQEQWYSPLWLIQAGLELLNIDCFDLDPFSPEDKALTCVPSKQHYSINNSAFDYMWQGNLFMNPPYSIQKLKDCIDYLQCQFKNIENALVIVPNQSCPEWTKFLNQFPYYVPNKRTRFYSPLCQSDSPRGEVKIVWVSHFEQSKLKAQKKRFQKIFRKYDPTGEGEVYQCAA